MYLLQCSCLKRETYKQVNQASYLNTYSRGALWSKVGLRLTKPIIIPHILWVNPGFVPIRSKPINSVLNHDEDSMMPSTTNKPAIQKSSQYKAAAHSEFITRCHTLFQYSRLPSVQGIYSTYTRFNPTLTSCTADRNA